MDCPFDRVEWAREPKTGSPSPRLIPASKRSPSSSLSGSLSRSLSSRSGRRVGVLLCEMPSGNALTL